MNIHTEGNRNHSKTKNCPTSMTKATVGLDNGMWSWGQKKRRNPVSVESRQVSQIASPLRYFCISF